MVLKVEFEIKSGSDHMQKYWLQPNFKFGVKIIFKVTKLQYQFVKMVKTDIRGAYVYFETVKIMPCVDLIEKFLWPSQSGRKFTIFIPEHLAQEPR